jgi:hypothetical protein
VKNSNEAIHAHPAGGRRWDGHAAARARRGAAPSDDGRGSRVGSTRGEGSDRVERRFGVERPELEASRHRSAEARTAVASRRRHGATQAQSKGES